jgi:hypothetical protein
MKKALFAAAILVALVLVSCDTGSTNTFAGTWKLSSYTVGGMTVNSSVLVSGSIVAKADNSYSWTQTIVGMDFTRTGTWAAKDLTVTLTDSTSKSLTYTGTLSSDKKTFTLVDASTNYVYKR